MVYRVFVEKKQELANEAKALLSDARTLLGIAALEAVLPEKEGADRW